MKIARDANTRFNVLRARKVETTFGSFGTELSKLTRHIVNSLYVSASRIA